MIKEIYPSGRYTQTAGASASTYVNNYSGAQGIGNMRFNTAGQRMEVYDGNNWVVLNMSSISVGLTQEAESLLDWAREKKNEELELRSRMEQHPGLKDAYERLEIMKALTLVEEKRND